MHTLRLLRPSDYQRMAWKNGGGITTEIARHPQSGSEFDWRISIAEIAQDGDFSTFPGVDRELMLLEGNGIDLVIGTDAPLRMDRRYQKHSFPGEAPVSCRLVDGATRDFNVMVRRSLIDAELIARTIVGTMVFFAAADTTWLIHVASGQISLRDRPTPLTAEAGESLIIDMVAGAPTLVIAGGGELVLVKLVSRKSSVLGDNALLHP
ncbi:MAG: HutD family protein [Tahibacter sp.]